MDYKLFDSELKVMEIIWEKEPVSAKQVSLAAAEQYGWNKNTTYTVLKKLVEKQVVSRSEPGFLCRALLGRDDVRRSETKNLISKLYGGSKKALFSSLLSDEKLSSHEIDELKKLVEKL